MTVAHKYSWVDVNSPVANSRTDDIWFFDDQTGWLINSNGQVCMTQDGGATWEQKFFLAPNTPGFPYLRCMGWANRQIGWFGAVTTYTGGTKDFLKILLHRTSDGGENWTPVLNLPEASAAGVCGFYAVNDQVAIGSGSNDPNLPGPGIIKTTNGGADWDYISMAAHADNLIDIYFLDEDIGWVVGGKNDLSCPKGKPGYETHPQYEQLKPVVLKTVDGGHNWVNTAATMKGYDCGEWGWKIQFLNEKTGFVSLENFTSAAILKTTDGGDSWVRLPIVNSAGQVINTDLEGVGFINETEGWVGGWGDRFEGLFNSVTEDGGATWAAENHINGDPNSDRRIKINRYRFLGDPVTAGYCSGARVYKLQKDADEADKAMTELCLVAPADGFALSHLAYQTTKSVEISYTLATDAHEVYIGIWNHFAFHVRTLVDGHSQASGRHTVVWDGTDDDGNSLGGGVYVCRLSVDGQRGESQSVRLPHKEKLMATVTWPTIKSYFTDDDIEHMKSVSVNWPRVLDLSNCEDVSYYAMQIHDDVKSGKMPIGGTRWTEEMVDNFYNWWKNTDPQCEDGT